MATGNRGEYIPDNHSNWMAGVRREMFDWGTPTRGSGIEMHRGEAHYGDDNSYGSVAYGRPGRYGNVTWKNTLPTRILLRDAVTIGTGDRKYKTLERAQQAADLKRNADIRREAGMLPARPKSTGKYKTMDEDAAEAAFRGDWGV